MTTPDIAKVIPRTPADTVAQAARVQSATLADVAGRRGALNGRIRPLHPSMKLAGTAITTALRRAGVTEQGEAL